MMMHEDPYGDSFDDDFADWNGHMNYEPEF